MDFKGKYNGWAELVNKALDGYITEKDTPEGSIYKAMRYSLAAGGKRLRPVLAIAACELLGGDIDDTLPYACAIEMIHTYSLIHDDLPAMDDDDYRRGRLTNHKVFGEATAILAGDALLNHAFELMLDHTYKKGDKLVQRLKAMGIIARASGPSGMIGGQVVDLESEDREITSGLLEYMHRCKTGALIKAPVLSAAVLADADKGACECLESYSEGIGLAFQIKDDILDVEGNIEVMGKPSGSDAAKKKTTFVTMHGLEKSKKMLDDITARAVDSLKGFGSSAEFMIRLAEYLVQRKS